MTATIDHPTLAPEDAERDARQQAHLEESAQAWEARGFPATAANLRARNTPEGRARLRANAAAFHVTEPDWEGITTQIAESRDSSVRGDRS